MSIFDKSKREIELELENKRLKEKLAEKNFKSTTTVKKKQVLYQCRYCGYKSIRNSTEGAPLPGFNNCPRHPKGVHKGPHSWMRTYL